MSGLGNCSEEALNELSNGEEVRLNSSAIGSGSGGTGGIGSGVVLVAPADGIASPVTLVDVLRPILKIDFFLGNAEPSDR